MLKKLLPKVHQAYLALPVFGPVLEDFVQWSLQRGYKADAIRERLFTLKRVARFFERLRVPSLKKVIPENFEAARRYLNPQGSKLGGIIHRFQEFLEQHHGIPSTAAKPPSQIEQEVERYENHLRRVRGFAVRTIAGHARCACAFLKFIGYPRSEWAWRNVSLPRIESFLRQEAKRCNRHTLQHVVAGLRGFLRFEHMEGKLPHPLHTRIDTPRVYRGELLPKAMAWSQVQALLASIDQSEPHGLRDYTLLLLMATYGLRSCEVVALTLDDIDWREAVIRVPQRKNRQRLPLPLTDEAGDALHRYLKHARPCSRVRELFLRTYPPRGPLVPTAVWYILNTRIRNSQLEMGPKGTHCLRHALAIRLLQQGVSTKSIGDVLSHRDLESTAGYLRFAVEELRDVGLAVPKGTFKAASSPPTIRPKFSPLTKSRSKLLGKNKQRFRSGLGPAIQRYVALKQALGREFSAEQRILLDWDASLYRHQRVARRVSASAFQHWAKTLVHLSPQGQRRRLQIVRNFLLFHARDHTVDFIPDLDTFPKRRPPRAPRLLTEVEMARVLAVTEQLSPSVENPLRSETLRTGFILLYCCGLRRGELLRLKIADLDLKQNLLHIEKTKFHKSRLVPFHQSVAQELVRFLALRRRKHMPVGNDSYLVFSARRQSPHGVFVGSAFIGLWQRLCLAAGVQDGRGGPPRVHDLRHSMATNALQRWYDQGLDINAKLPHLATYLGHVSVASTHYYLRFTAQVRESASERFRQLCMPLFDDGGKA